jgi:hypothetical protein
LSVCLKMKTVELKTRNIASTKTIHHVDMTAMTPIIVIIWVIPIHRLMMTMAEPPLLTGCKVHYTVTRDPSCDAADRDEKKEKREKGRVM